MILSSIDF